MMAAETIELGNWRKQMPSIRLPHLRWTRWDLLGTLRRGRSIRVHQFSDTATFCRDLKGTAP